MLKELTQGDEKNITAFNTAKLAPVLKVVKYYCQALEQDLMGVIAFYPDPNTLNPRAFLIAIIPTTEARMILGPTEAEYEETFMAALEEEREGLQARMSSFSELNQSMGSTI